MKTQPTVRCPAIPVGKDQCVLESGHDGFHHVQPAMGPIYLSTPECDECPYPGGCGERRCERIEDPSTPEEPNDPR